MLCDYSSEREPSCRAPHVIRSAAQAIDFGSENAYLLILSPEECAECGKLLLFPSEFSLELLQAKAARGLLCLSLLVLIEAVGRAADPEKGADHGNYFQKDDWIHVCSLYCSVVDQFFARRSGRGTAGGKPRNSSLKRASVVAQSSITFSKTGVNSPIRSAS
jgi:hypothetical protein